MAPLITLNDIHATYMAGGMRLMLGRWNSGKHYTYWADAMGRRDTDYLSQALLNLMPPNCRDYEEMKDATNPNVSEKIWGCLVVLYAMLEDDENIEQNEYSEFYKNHTKEAVEFVLGAIDSSPWGDQICLDY